MGGLGYKNERILLFGLDILLVSIGIGVLYLIFRYPDFFPYVQELEEARAMILPEQYVEKMNVIESRFNTLLMQCGFIYWIYESFCLIMFGQTFGQRVFQKKLIINWNCKYPGLLRMFLMPTRTLVKVFCIIWTIPMLILGGLFLFGRKNQTLLDVVFFTKLEDNVLDA